MEEHVSCTMGLGKLGLPEGSKEIEEMERSLLSDLMLACVSMMMIFKGI
jgi:hypothetical protein